MLFFLQLINIFQCKFKVFRITNLTPDMEIWIEVQTALGEENLLDVKLKKIGPANPEGVLMGGNRYRNT